MATFATLTELNGLAKPILADGLIDLTPKVAKLQNLVSFVPADKQLGDQYLQTVVTSDEQGFSYAVHGDGAFTLNDSISMATKQAAVRGTQLLLRSSMSYEAAAKASNSKKAFAEGPGLQMKNQLKSMKKRIEIDLFHGQKGLGVTASSANTNTTTTVVTLTAASFASLIWAGTKNAQVSFYKVSDNTIASSGADAIFTISVVNVANRTLTLTGTTTGIAALDTAIASVAYNVFWYGSVTGSAGTFAHKSMAGLNKIITNTGTLFGIDAAAEDLWAGTTYSAGSAALNMQKILAAVSGAVNKGLDEDVDVFLNPNTWANVMSDLSASRQYDGSYNKSVGENGFEALKFHSQNGSITLHAHAIVKAGEGYVVVPKWMKRIGAQDVSFTTPGRSEEIFMQSATVAGYETRLYTDQALFCEAPAKFVYISGIVNDA